MPQSPLILSASSPDILNAASPDILNGASPDAVARAGAALQAGSLVAFATETVYGLGADATNDRAVAAIFAAKGRPDFNPLIIHVDTLAAARRLADFTPLALSLADRFWPGPLTLVLRRRTDCPVSLLASAGLDTIAIRIPAHPCALALLAAAQCPVAAPSANRSGRISPTRAQDVREELGDRVALILDGGPCAVGVESTVLDLTSPSPRLLRPGGITEEALAARIGPLTAAPTIEDRVARSSPGLMASHYAPRLPVRLDAIDAEAGEAFVAFGPPPPGVPVAAQLSAQGDVDEAAAALFAVLRSLDRPPFRAIAVMPIPQTGLGRAVNDRLRRAAAPRPAQDRSIPIDAAPRLP